jgi:hypothetical protein
VSSVKYVRGRPNCRPAVLRAVEKKIGGVRTEMV